jgi:tripartite-type tricarboxylate transporter receptor subunit TctC
MCRLLANGLTKVLGKTVIVDNRPGSGGITGLAEKMPFDPRLAAQSHPASHGPARGQGPGRS